MSSQADHSKGLGVRHARTWLRRAPVRVAGGLNAGLRSLAAARGCLCCAGCARGEREQDHLRRLAGAPARRCHGGRLQPPRRGEDPAKEYGKLARNWRANVVRLSVHPSTWRYHESETLTLLEEHVQNATDAGLFVIVDYHVIGFPDSYY